MAKINSLDLATGVQLRSLSKGLLQATSKIKTFSTGVNKIAGGVAIGNLFSSAISKGLASAKGLLSTGFQVAIDDEQASIALTTIIGDTEKAQETLKALTDFGASTPFQIPALRKAATQLLSFGISNEELIGTMKNLGDVSAGLNVPLGDLAAIYGKTSTLGKAGNEQLLQFAERGVPIYQQLAKQMGTTAEGIKGMASKGQIGFDQIKIAFQDLTAEGSTFGGLMEKQSQSLGGVISTLKDNYELALGKIAAAFTDTFDIKLLIEDATSIIQNTFIPAIAGVADYVKSWKPQFQFAYALIKNLGLVWELAYTSMGFSAVKTFNQVVHFLSETIPAAMQFLYRNGTTIFTRFFENLFHMQKTTFMGLVKLLSSIPQLISGEVTVSSIIGDTIKDLKAGIQPLADERFEAPERQVTGVEKALGEDVVRLKGNLMKAVADSFKEQQRRSQKITDDANAVLKRAEVPTSDVKKEDDKEPSENKFASAAEFGSQAAKDIILGAIGGVNKDKVQEDQLDVQEEILNVQRQQLQKANTTSNAFNINEVAIVG